MLVELSCGVTMAPAYIPGLLKRLVPGPRDGGARPSCVAKSLLTYIYSNRYKSTARSSIHRLRGIQDRSE